MDQELVAYLDRMSQQIEGLRGEIDGLRGEMGSLRGEMAQQMGSLRGEMTQQMGSLRGEMTQEMGGLREEVRQENRHTRVLMEGLRSDIQLMAEVAMDTRQMFARHQSEVERRLEEMKVLISPLYKELNTRVTLLEERAERQERDAMEVLREKFGKRQI